MASRKTPESAAADAAIEVPEQAPADSASVLASDEYAGLGGSYIFDPVSGKRTPAPSQADPAPETTPEKE